MLYPWYCHYIKKISFILDRNLAKANCTENYVCTSCDTVVLVISNYLNPPRHGGALDVPPGPALAKGRVPGRFPFLGGLPKGEVNGVPFPGKEGAFLQFGGVWDRKLPLRPVGDIIEEHTWEQN